VVTVDSEPVAGRYQLIREVGRGGMGSVWLARDEVLGRQVALKRLGQLHGAQNQARAEREAQLAARLSHRNVVTVFDLAEDGETRWLVMEYVEGTTLAQFAADRGGLPAAEAAIVVRQAAEALRVAHEAGIVHRDVKPSNLIVGADGTTRLADFGIARGVADDTLTATGVLTGSPAYIAPEVATGGPATSASDMWSLGGTVYQAVTGRPPYELGDNVLGGLLRIVHDEPPRLPPEAGPLATVLAATMVKDPEQRWTAAQVCAFLDGAPAPVRTEPTRPLRPVSATAPVAPGESTTRVQRRRRSMPVWPLAAGFLVLLLVVGAWLVGRSGSNSPAAGGDPERSPAAPTTSVQPSRPASSATPSGPTAEAMSGFVSDYLGTVTSQPQKAFGMLTPSFQKASGGYRGYHSWWGPVRSASVSDVHADPDAMTVSYHVVYDGPSSRPSSDDVRLRLVYQSGRYLIDGESK
jgi:serine/threonine protein kinase